MTDLLNSSVVLPLQSARDELTPLNRTVKHTLSLASERGLLTVPPDSQHQRRAPSTWGCRCDAFFWDAWDRSIRGEDDMHCFFQIAQRIGGSLAALEETDAANLLPGGVMDTIGSCSDLFLPDYWLFVVHHLGSTWQLPYECHVEWCHGSTFKDEPYAVVSRLPVNIVQASIDALTVLIDAAVPFEWSPVDCQPASLAGANDDSKPIALLQLETSAQKQVSNEVLGIAQRENEAAIERLQRCEATNTWPTGYEDLRVFDSL